MSSGTPPHDDAHEWRNYLREMQRADRAAAVAARYELQSGQPPESMRPFRERMAALHRQMERRHRACARLYRLHNRRLQRWSDEGAEAERPPFMSAVADDLGLDSAAVILFDEQWQEVLTAASDARPLARRLRPRGHRRVRPVPRRLGRTGLRPRRRSRTDRPVPRIR
ncbi:hypothetical protein [Nocardia wallacei]|uniref:hypothetical protein n=1 Tax=Nocardia wallacei TaxID=480035 RepID=UPI00245825FB|nr:hypothetical protein [Nocardia wallacei]